MNYKRGLNVGVWPLLQWVGPRAAQLVARNCRWQGPRICPCWLQCTWTTPQEPSRSGVANGSYSSPFDFVQENTEYVLYQLLAIHLEEPYNFHQSTKIYRHEKRIVSFLPFLCFFYRPPDQLSGCGYRNILVTVFSFSTPDRHCYTVFVSCFSHFN